METTESLRPRTEAAGKILEAASELFYRDGIRAVGVDAIVSESGVTKMTLYKHFGSKDRLAAAYLQARDERWRGWLTEFMEERGGSPAERISVVFEALGEWLESREGIRGCAFVNASVEIADREHPAQVVIEDQKRWMRGFLERLATEAGAESPEELADQLFVLFEGATVAAAMRTGKEPIERAKEAAGILFEKSRA